MKKSFAIILLSCLLSSNFVLADSWDDFSNLDETWDAQKTVPNSDYEEVVNALEEKKEAVEQKKKKKRFRKLFSAGGTTLHKDIKPESEIKEIQDIEKKDEGILTNVFVDLLLDGVILEKGYYKIIAERDEQKKIHIKFYQSQFLRGEIIAEETNDDYGQEAIDFAKLLPYNQNFVKFIFGSIDFNAYAYIPYLDL